MYLEHHGVKGQKWGVRRYQNPDGTLTEEGKKRYIKRSAISGGIAGGAFGGYAGAVLGLAGATMINPAATIGAGATYAAALGGVSLGSVMAYAGAKANKKSAKSLLEAHPNITSKELAKRDERALAARTNKEVAQQFMRQVEINNFTMHQIGVY